MKDKFKLIISIICSIIGIALSLFGLIMGLKSIGGEGFEQLGIIFIFPSIVALVIIVLDILATIGKLKNALTYSYISSLIKIAFIIVFIPNTIYDYECEMRHEISDLSFDLIVIASLSLVAIPSILNIINLRKIKI